MEVAQDFIYLGSKVSNDNNMVAELSAMMLAANRYSLKNQSTLKNLSRRTKLISTYIVPVLTYASETWTLSKSDETLLAAFERKMLRRIRMCGRTMEEPL